MMGIDNPYSDPSVSNSQISEEDDYCPGDSQADCIDDESTLDEEEQNVDENEIKDELSALQNEGEMSLEELLRLYEPSAPTLTPPERPQIDEECDVPSKKSRLYILTDDIVPDSESDEEYAPSWKKEPRIGPEYQAEVSEVKSFEPISSCDGSYLICTDGEYCEPVAQASWECAEIEAFESGLATIGKDFFRLQAEFLPGRTVKELVHYFYLWKKTPRYLEFAQQIKFHRRRRIFDALAFTSNFRGDQQTTPNTIVECKNDEAGSEHVNNSNEPITNSAIESMK